MKKPFRKITVLFLVFTILSVLTACSKTEAFGTSVGGDTVFTDAIERPTDIPVLEELDYIKYPEKPAEKPAAPNGIPTVGQASTASEYYRIEEVDGATSIKFNEVERWDYVYLPINNFSAEYQNIKITAIAKNIQKVAITALYYEMYETNSPAVTTFIGDVGDTEQFYIMELGKIKVLDSSYYPKEEALGSKTVLGLCLFIDSNPSQNVVNKNTTNESEFKITSVEFLKDGDPSLGDRYVEPSLSVGYLDPGYTAVKNDETREYTITKSASAGVWESASLSVSNYSSEYSAFTLNFTTTNVSNFTIELTVSGGQAGWADNVLVYKATNLADGAHEAYIDFSSTEPTDSTTWMPVPGYFIKNYKISAIKVYLDTADATEMSNEEGICVINQIKFDRIASEGTTISKGWNAGTSYITIGDDLAIGGVGTVNFTWYSSWEYLSIPVLNYEPAEKLIIKFQANEGIDYMGIALGSADFKVNNECVLKSCWNKITVIEEEKVEEKEGIVETVEFDEATNIYTITFDFKDAVKSDLLGGKRANEVQITSLKFYLNDPNSKAVFEGSRSVRFISISFE